MPRVRPATVRAVLLPLTLLSEACASSPGRPAATTPQPSCAVRAAAGARADSVVVATVGPIGAAHVPIPQTTGERFVFAQSYETLINVDCEGRAYGGLAASWTADATKTRITLTLRSGARFHDGAPLHAGDVVAAWRTTAEGPGVGAQLARRLADAATIVDDRTLVISLPDSQSVVLAHSALAVYRRSSSSIWPEGSGPYRVDESGANVEPGVLVLLPVATRAGPRVTVRSGRITDPRDDIDAGVDILTTTDPVAVRYANTRPGVSTIPLPWDRTHLLAVPGDSGVAATLIALNGDSAAAVRASLARDAVRVEARPAEPPFWWSDVGSCAFQNPNPSTPSARARVGRIVYRRDDQVGRAIAERLVALTGRGTAVALTPAELAGALRTGGDLGYVVELPRRSLARCQDLAALWSSIPWLTSGVLSPLVDTRARAIVKRERVSATIDWDGTLRMSGSAGPP